MNATALLYLATRAPKVTAMPKIRGDRYQRVKAQVRERCEFYRLDRYDTQACVDHAAKLMRRGRSAAVAVSEGVRMAKDLAATRDNWQPGGAA